MTRIVRALVLAAIVMLGMSSPAGAAPTADKDLCKNSGYVHYTDHDGGQPFTNQGQCVSAANKGGIVRIPPPPSCSSLTRFRNQFGADIVLIQGCTGLQPYSFIVGYDQYGTAVGQSFIENDSSYGAVQAYPPCEITITMIGTGTDGNAYVLGISTPADDPACNQT